jgi:hemolysin III
VESATGALPDRELVQPPLLRGWLHLTCFFLALPAGWALVRVAEPDAARVGAVVYAAGVAALFGVSGTYHRRRWTPLVRSRLQRLDRATIFVMIAATYTPLCLSVLGGVTGTALLVAVWAGATAGVLLSVFTTAHRQALGLALYIPLGWLGVIALPQLASRLNASELVLIVAGGVLYTAGAVLLQRRWPDPVPRVLGYHEVWHAIVVAAVICHYLAVRSVLQRLG